MVSGIRAAEMALRLRYDDVEVGHIEPDLRRCLDGLIGTTARVRVFCTYTAMLQLRRHLSTLTTLARASTDGRTDPDRASPSRDMNIYGDHGNVLALARRLEWHGYRAEVLEVNRGDPIPDRIDLIVGGGGQDAGQTRVEGDLKRQARELTRAADDGAPMLVVAGCTSCSVTRSAPGAGSSSPESASSTSRPSPAAAVDRQRGSREP